MSRLIDNGNVCLDVRWTRKLKGEIFCSPGGGFGCKKEDLDQATALASACAALLGAGWQSRVWENGGWWQVRKGAAKVSPTNNGGLDAELRRRLDDVRETLIRETRATAREAVEAVIEALNLKIAALKRALVSVSLVPAQIEDVSVSE